MDNTTVSAVTSGSSNHPRDPDAPQIGYGTAGFRRKAAELDHVLYRVGLLAALRSKSRGGATVGAMITASHNPEEDNGVKVIDPLGEMLEARWEKHAAQLANARDQDVISCLKSIMATEEIDFGMATNVAVAMDTRASSPSLMTALVHGVEAMSGNLVNYGLMTTPQLHFMVRCINTSDEYGKPTKEGYFEKVTRAFHKLANQLPIKGSYSPNVCVDAANGVGALALSSLQGYLGNQLDVSVTNDGTQGGKLNYKCGADYVKIQQKGPEGVELQPGVRYASFDGDADRIVFYFMDKDSAFHLLDGDKIATLITGFLKDKLTDCDLDLDLGIVQTAYANGSSAKYITDTLGVRLVCAATGVKHLHKEALQMDIGVYFEANGHGTVLFSDKATQMIQKGADNQNLTSKQKEAFVALSAFMDVTNQTVGDSVSDLLLVELVLRYRGWGAEEWNQTYTDLPNRQLKVLVKDRNVIKTTDAERRTTSPAGLQEAIDRAVAKYSNGRSFVRPSGTEDVVRVYAEAASKPETEDLSHEVSVIVYKQCGGVGDPPRKS